MANVSAGTAYVEVVGDFTKLNAQVAAATGPLAARFGKLGKAATVGLAGVTVGAVAAGKALYDIGQSFDTAYDTISQTTGKTGKSLDRLKKDFRSVVSQVPADFDDAAQAVAGLNQRLGTTGQPLRVVAKQLLELSRMTKTDLGSNIQAVTRLFGDWSVKTRDQSRTLDGLFRLSQKTGIEVGSLAENLVQFGSPLRQLGFDLETAAAMFSRFEREGVNTTTLLPGLRFAIKAFSGATAETTANLKAWGVSLADPQKALGQVMELIKAAPTDLKANAIAFQVFGQRAGPDMAAAIREGRFSLDQLIRVMKTGDETILGASRRTRDFSENWKIFKNRVMVALEPLANDVFKGVSKAMSQIGKVLTDPKLSGSEKFGKLMDMAADAIADGLPKVAHAAAVAGPKIALALVKGFVNADIWSKALIAGVILAKMGKLSGPMTALGSKLGGRFGLTFARGFILAVIGAELAKQVKKIIEGEKLGQTGREEFAVAISEWGDEIGIQFESAGFIGKNKIRVATAFGDLIFNAKTQQVIAAKGKRLQQFVGKSIETLMPRLQTMSQRVGRRGGDALTDNYLNALKPLPKRAGEKVKPVEPSVARILGRVAQNSRDRGQDTRDNFLRYLTPLPGKVGRALNPLPDKADGPMFRLAKTVVTALVNLNAGAGGVLDKVVGTVGNALRSLGVSKKLSFTVESAAGILGNILNAAGLGRQRGGPIDLGKLSGDSVPAMLERGEYVLNRRAVSAVGLENLDALNFAAAPRFQKGGAPHLAGREPLRSIGQGGIDMTWAAAIAYLKKNRPARGPGGVKGPKGVGTYAGMPMANWVIESLQHAAGKGVNPTPTSGYRSHAYNVSQGRDYYSEHEGTQYPHGAVDFGGYTTGLAAKMSVVRATSGFKYPLLAPIGFEDDGHASGTGHRRGGRIRGFRRGGSPSGFINKVFPATAGSVNVLPGFQIARLAEHFGMPGRTMEVISRGESGGDPGALEGGHGPGLGLWQITPPWNSDLIRKYGGAKAMRNPVQNAKAARDIARRQGIDSAWVAGAGNYNAHYNGAYTDADLREDMTRGGGGGGGGGPNRPPAKPPAIIGQQLISPPGIGRSMLVDPGKIGLPRSIKLPRSWRKLPAWIRTLLRYPHLPYSTIEAVASSAVDAATSTPNISDDRYARQFQIDVEKARLKQVKGRLAKITEILKKSRMAPSMRKRLQGQRAALIGTFLGLRTDIGRGLGDLSGTQSEQRDEALRQLLLEANQRTAVSQAQYKVFAGLGAIPSFAEGGVVPGPPGRPILIRAHGGEVVLPKGDGADVRVVVEDHRIRTFVNDREVRAIVKDETNRSVRAGSRLLPGRGGGR